MRVSNFLYNVNNYESSHSSHFLKVPCNLAWRYFRSIFSNLLHAFEVPNLWEYDVYGLMMPLQASTLTQNVTGPVRPVTPRI